MSMTYKQKKVISYIEDNLGIRYDGFDDVKSAVDFIHKYIEESKNAREERNVFNCDIDGGWSAFGEMFMPDLDGEV